VKGARHARPRTSAWYRFEAHTFRTTNFARPQQNVRGLASKVFYPQRERQRGNGSNRILARHRFDRSQQNVRDLASKVCSAAQLEALERADVNRREFLLVLGVVG